MQDVIIDPVRGMFFLDGVSGVRYGNEYGLWDPAAPARVANFILGHDVDTRVDVLNESMLDVVQPVNEFWNPEEGTADLEITDLNSGGVRLGLSLGQWVVRYRSKRLRVISHNEAIGKHFPQAPALTFSQELEALINKHSKENGSDTPDFILANYLTSMLREFDRAVNQRTRWTSAGQKQEEVVAP